MEHSHIFTSASGNESVWSPGLSPLDSPQGCPLGPLPVIYYSALLCLGLPGKEESCPVCVCVHDLCLLVFYSMSCMLTRNVFVSDVCVRSWSVCCAWLPECHSLQKDRKLLLFTAR